VCYRGVHGILCLPRITSDDEVTLQNKTNNNNCLIYSNNLFFPALALIGRPEGLERTGSSNLIFDSAEFLFLNFAAESFLFPFPLFFSSFGRKSSIVFELKLDMDWRGRLKIEK
jgi:hypothetical protein